MLAPIVGVVTGQAPKPLGPAVVRMDMAAVYGCEFLVPLLLSIWPKRSETITIQKSKAAKSGQWVLHGQQCGSEYGKPNYCSPLGDIGQRTV